MAPGAIGQFIATLVVPNSPFVNAKRRCPVPGAGAKRIQENLLEMALRGQPKAPFYMVGRMEGQSVVLRAEKGKLKLTIDNGNQNQELIYDLKADQTSVSTGPGILPDRKGPGDPG